MATIDNLTKEFISAYTGDNKDEDDGQEAAKCQNQEQQIEQCVGNRADSVQPVHVVVIDSSFLSHYTAPP